MQRASLFLILAGSAAAQSFNLDVGLLNGAHGAGSPGPAYAGAAGLSGHWMFVDGALMAGSGSATSPDLVDVDGQTSAVRLHFDVQGSGTFGVLSADEPLATGDDASLLEDTLFCLGSSPYSVSFEGLQAGEYELYTYGLAPDSPEFRSLVDVPTGTGGAQLVGGAFPASGHALGVSYALHHASVAAGQDLLVLLAEAQGTEDSLNGLQLVRLGDQPLGSYYCAPAVPNSSGLPGAVAAHGSLQVSDADLRVRARYLPEGQFGYFLASRTQGFVPNPFGSQGHLCVVGSIARFSRPGEVGPALGGILSLQVPLTDVPEPPSFAVSVQPGESWSFQCWHRDVIPSGPTSNFTDAVELQFL